MMSGKPNTQIKRELELEEKTRQERDIKKRGQKGSFLWFLTLAPSLPPFCSLPPLSGLLFFRASTLAPGLPPFCGLPPLCGLLFFRASTLAPGLPPLCGLPPLSGLLFFRASTLAPGLPSLCSLPPLSGLLSGLYPRPRPPTPLWPPTPFRPLLSPPLLPPPLSNLLLFLASTLAPGLPPVCSLQFFWHLPLSSLPSFFSLQFFWPPTTVQPFAPFELPISPVSTSL